MDHIRILKRAFNITINYRILWLFGILLALTTGGGGGSSGGGGNSGSRIGLDRDFPSIPGFPNISQEVVSGIIAAGIVLICVFILVGIAFTILRYVSETALIRLVNEHENTGEKVGFTQGFKMGWSRAAFRMFLVDLLIGFTAAVTFILLFLVALAPLLLWVTRNESLGILGTVIAIGLGLIIIFLAIVTGIAVSLIIQFVRRVIVLENLGVFASIKRGFELVRRRLGDVVVMGLILFGLGLAWVVVMIPVIIVLGLAGVMIGGLPALLVGFVASQFMQGAGPWILAGLVGLPIFILVIVVPGLFLSGLVQTFVSSTWTLSYREVLVLEGNMPVVNSEKGLPEEPVVDSKTEATSSEDMPEPPAA